MTEKLFYKDSYHEGISGQGSILYPNVREVIRQFLRELPFSPKEAGQSADTGFFYTEDGREIPVTDVQEKDGTVFHYIAAPVKEGEEIKGKLDFKERFSKMQQHTGEHIVSGLGKSSFRVSQRRLSSG